MSYLEMVNDAQHDAHNIDPIPAAHLDFALAFKQPEFFARNSNRLPVLPEFANLPATHRDILTIRKIGNQLVKFSVASDLAQQTDKRLLTLYDVHENDEYTYDELMSTALKLDSDGNLPEIHLGGHQRSDFETEDMFSYHTNAAVIDRIADAKLAALTPADRNKFRRAYVNVIPGSFPSASWYQPPFGNNDVTLTQAFGRNTITDAELPEMVVEKRASNPPDEVTFTALLHEGFDPGESNYELADEIALQLQDPTRNIEQVIQWEPAYALWETHNDIFRAYRPAIHIVWPKSDFYPTHEVKADSIELMKQKGLFNPFEFAHPDMMIRAAAILSKQGVQADVLDRDIPFDSESAQPWTRGPGAWVPREFAARAEHILRLRVATPKKLKKPKSGDHGH